MENITLEQIALAVAFIVGLATGLAYMHKIIKTWISNSLKDQFSELNAKMDEMTKRIDKVDMDSCKNYLVNFLLDVDQAQEVDEIEKERFWEQYQHYEKIGGNSYIHRKVEQLKADGKL